MDKILDLFKKHNLEYLEFEKIPEDDRLSESPDLCQFKLLHSLLKKEHQHKDIIRGTSHDEIYLMGIDELEFDNFKMENNIIYLIRCGVRYSSEFGCLSMFV